MIEQNIQEAVTWHVLGAPFHITSGHLCVWKIQLSNYSRGSFHSNECINPSFVRQGAQYRVPSHLSPHLAVDRVCASGHFQHLTRNLAPWKKSYDKPRHGIKKQRHHFANKGPYRESYGLCSSPVQMWELDHKEGRETKKWCFRTVVLEKTLEHPLGSKEIKPVHPKGNQPWYSLEGLLLEFKF